MSRQEMDEEIVGHLKGWRLLHVTYSRRLSLTGFLFAAPVLLFFTIFSAGPMLSAFYFSFTNYDLVSQRDFVGLANYNHVLTGGHFTQAAGVTARFALLFAVPCLAISFFVALLLKGNFRGKGLYRWVFFAPSMLSLVGMSVVWRIMLNKMGPINAILGLNISWLTDRRFALAGISMMEVWRSMGFYMIMFLVGLQAIPQEYYDAAAVDGASTWQSLRWITLPLLRPTFALVTIIAMIQGVKVFTPMYMMTEGGPANATRSAVFLVYRTGLKYWGMGLASAESVVLFLVMLVFTLFQLRLFRVGREV